MSKSLAVFPAALAIALSGCGASHLSGAQQADLKPGEAKAQQIFAQCVPNVFALALASVRHKTQACVKAQVPAQKRQAVGRCVTNGLVTIRSKAAGEALLAKCISDA